MNRSPRRPRSRAGFTLTELMIVVVLVGLIGSMLTSLLMRQQSFHRAVATVADARARMRDVATILPTDMRSISTSGGDVLVLSDTSMQIRAFVGASILCSYVAGSPTVIELPPKILSDSSVLTAWINPPRPGDMVYLYNDSTSAGNADDSWTPFAITDTASSTSSTWCPTSTSFTHAGDNTARRYRLTLAAAPNQAQIKAGAPIRIAREVRYSGYQASDGNWYVGYQTCTYSGTMTTAGACGTRDVLAGPIQAVTTDENTSGLYFKYYNQKGTRLTWLPSLTTASPDSAVARAEVVIRTVSQSLRRATRINVQNTEITGGDSLRFNIGFRNRI
ncbi:MAG TPA: prepilin-type N-terminal cleavage/methylation domain-containing protein [Gemmatimonadaceae bacterium]|nr:prepilin-type N-terminal cleavage/methylation domain-containing protein [Gemmatimonadaceae bacterium]